MTRPFLIRILLLAILLLVAGLSAHAQTGIYAVTVQELNIRRGPVTICIDSATIK